MPRLLASLLLPLPLVAALAGCPAAPEDPGCATDADCPTGRVCSAGACGPPSHGGGGSGGEGPPLENECGTSADCLPRPFAIVPTIYWDGSLDGVEQVCTVPIRSCPGSVECTVPTICADVPPDATRLGAMRCERDDQCAGGRCIAIEDGISVCLRACTIDGDCPQVLPEEAIPPDPVRWNSPPIGFRCEERLDHSIPLRLCVPLDPATPAATLCRSDCDCVPGDDCQLTATDPRCRFTGYTWPFIEAVPVCAQRPPGVLRPTLDQCHYDPASCEGGACILPCQNGTPGFQSFCLDPPYRCTQPCDGDDDCPARTACRDGDSLERIGGWMLQQQDAAFPGRAVRYCQLPPEGCYDEIDCCPVPDGQGGCVHGWSDDKRRCGVFISPPEDRPRLLTKCLILDPPSAGPATPGQCCAAHADCDSNLCVPARAGTRCDGGGVCSVPCDPDPRTPPEFDYRDRCAITDFGAETYHQGSSCKPYHYVEPYTDRDGAPATLEVDLNACQ